MNIVDYKARIDSLVGNLLNEYMKLETMYLQEKNKSTNELIDINKMNSSVTSNLQSKIDEVYALDKEIQGYKSKEQEYINTIENQRTQLDELTKGSIEETTTNKFDMLRSQAKEITCKDKEIIRLTKEMGRLTKEIGRLKEMNDMKQNLSIVMKDTPDNIIGWSPTSSPLPNKDDIADIQLDTPDNKDSVGEDIEEEIEDEEFFEIYYRKKKYYRDSNNKVYEIADDEDVGNCIGDWVKQANGKFKLVKP